MNKLQPASVGTGPLGHMGDLINREQSPEGKQRPHPLPQCPSQTRDGVTRTRLGTPPPVCPKGSPSSVGSPGLFGVAHPSPAQRTWSPRAALTQEGEKNPTSGSTTSSCFCFLGSLQSC